MTVEKLERVMYRIRLRNPDRPTSVPRIELERAIMLEIGTDKRTYELNKRALVRLGWIKSHGHNVEITNEDLL